MCMIDRFKVGTFERGTYISGVKICTSINYGIFDEDTNISVREHSLIRHYLGISLCVKKFVNYELCKRINVAKYSDT